MLKSKRILAVAGVVMASALIWVGLIGSTSTAATHDGPTRSATSSKAIEVTTYGTKRYEIDTKQKYEEFVARFERAVPMVSPNLWIGASDWNEVVSKTAAAATNGFLIYAKYTNWPWANMSGTTGLDQRRGAMYLMGNHVIAETMYRYNPGVMIHAPLRPMIFENERGDAVFLIERPSDQFAAYGDKRIAEVGLQLDHKLAHLLEVLDVPVPSGLTR